MAPEALRRRIAHGNVYPTARVETALNNYFRIGNLTALRELALLWLADKVDEQLDQYRAAHHISAPWEAHERVVVGLTGGPEGDTLIRRAARIAARSRRSDLLAVHVSGDHALTGTEQAWLTQQRHLVESLGGTYHQVVGADIPTALLEFARGVNATQLVLGASRRGRLAQLFSRGVGTSVTAHGGPIDVHLVTHPEAERPRRRRAGGEEQPQPEIAALGAVTERMLRGAPPLAAVLDQLRDAFQLTAVTLLQRRPERLGGPELPHDPRAWRVVAGAGGHHCRTPDEGDAAVMIDSELTLVLHGHPLPAADQRILAAFGALAAAALRQQRRAEAAAGPPSDAGTDSRSTDDPTRLGGETGTGLGRPGATCYRCPVPPPA